MNNSKFKFCVIGNGTISASVLMLLIEAYQIENLNVEITCIYDLSIPPVIDMSESTTFRIPVFLRNIMDFSFQEDLPMIDGTIKFGTKYINFKDKDFYTNYYNGQIALQMDSSKFIEFVFRKTNEMYNDIAKVVYDNVKCIKGDSDGAIVEMEHEEIKYDYVFDCRGLPKTDELKTDDYDCSFEIPVNSMISYSEEKHYSEMYTDCTATKDGWMFGIPLRTRKTFGYVYNNQVTPKEDAIKNFRELKQISDNIELQSLSWNSFFKKQAYNNHILTLGNRLFFTEPFTQLGTGDVEYCLSVALVFLRLLFYNNDLDNPSGFPSGLNDKTEKTATNEYYDDYIKKYIIMQSSALYQTSSIIESEFWKYAKDVSTKNLIKLPEETINRIPKTDDIYVNYGLIYPPKWI